MIQRALVIAAILASAPARAEDPPPPGLTTETFHTETKLDLHWQLLMLPEQVIELAFVPVGLLVGVVERHRLDKRVATLLKFGRVKLSPRFKVSFGDGLGFGAKIKYDGEVGLRTQASLGFIYRLDADFLIDGELVQPIGSIDDRELRLAVEIERDQNERFYGTLGERRVLANNHQSVVAGIDLQPSDWYDYAGLFELGVMRQTLAPGVDPAEIPLGDPMDSVAPPPGFNTNAVYATTSLVGTFDTRDTLGRPSRGVFAELRALALVDVRDQNFDLAGARLKASASWFLPVMPEARVLVLSAGASAALPLFRGATIPLPAISELGREQHLRGYDRVRFRDRYAVWAGIEYRFPIYEYLNTDVGLDTFVFVEGATAFGDAALSRETLHYSTGGGLRVAHETTLISQLTIGWSPEGFEIFIGGEIDL